MPRLTVSMPVGGPLDGLARAAGSVLAQDVDLHLVIVNDGGNPEAVRARLGGLLDDPRLIVYDLPENRGRYFADALVYYATDSPFFTIHDADDWSEPGRYGRMIALLDSTGADVAPGGVTHHWIRGGAAEEAPPRMPKSGGPQVRHLWNLCAMYRRPALRGLLRPDWKVGYDTLLAYALHQTAKITVYNQCDYHWRQTHGSLTTSSTTGFGTAYRAQVRDKVIRKANRLMNRAGRITRSSASDIIGPASRESVTALSSHVRALRAILQGPASPVDARDIVLTVLTGARPDLLAQTLASVADSIPGLLETADVRVLVNGGDAPTLDVVRMHRRPRWTVYSHDGPIHTIGEATSKCARVAYDSGRDWWMHLEDDWEAHRCDGGLDLARSILRENPEVSQIRLRQFGEVRPTERWARVNMVTLRPLVWIEQDGWSYSPDCHLTQTPFLMRAKDTLDAYPAPGERDAMKNWRKAGHLGIARICPGYFTHLGGQDSLKKRTGSPP